MSKKGWFTDWFNSSYYHALYQHRDDTEALQFIHNLLAYLKPMPHAKMLDIACGKGRHSKALFDAGFDVVGIDLSPASINAASSMKTNGLTFSCHDMRETFRNNYFDYAFNFFTSFGYFNSDEEHQLAIQAMSNNLKEGGTLVIDYLNVSIVDSTLDLATETQIDGFHFQIKKWQDPLFLYKEIKVVDALTQEELGIFEEKVRKYTLHDFMDFMQKAGLTIVATFGNYQLDPFNPENADRLIIVAQKHLNS
ncbi:MAG: class I SAM-dependent methyltransferase [Bacteroidetes bacterium]|jgi:ubiquinone/menaquinone biosynthesis C-methylase UbiE|nr:class I SAM-dependent methyltransferase [Bacteroidota bacterium]